MSNEPVLDSGIDNNLLKDVENKNREQIIANEGDYEYLYPSLDDPRFNEKIVKRKEFSDTRYQGKQEGKIIEIADKLCNAEFELAPHQMFVRNFLSFQTPYNGLLLYHGLGSGKTCSAISVAEEMRDYLKQMGITQRIIVVAAPNVQDNFKLQLFDERKLKLINGLWNIRACTGNKYMKEINPMNMQGLSKDKVVRQVKRIINTAYLFLGYIEFANYISKKSIVTSDMSDDKKQRVMKEKLIKSFINRLIIIDEVHNIRISDDKKDKRVASELTKLVENVPNLRLLLLSATPMYNSYKEIVWLLNLLNTNDRRATFSIKDIFNGDGSFKLDSDGREIGKELLMRKATGYVSFVRGENPYTFPFRIWPSEFSPKNTYALLQRPTVQLNGTPIVQPLEILSVYLSDIGEYQENAYNYIINKLKRGDYGVGDRKMPSFENMEAFGYTILQRPLEALNIIYPDKRLLDEEPSFDSKELVGKSGLNRIMKYEESTSPMFKGNFEYKTDDYGAIFSPSEIGKYSGKIKTICDTIINSTGVVLIYSQWIDAGLVPMALALEELGFSRTGKGQNLFKRKPAPLIDALTYETTNVKTEDFKPASYIMITGDNALSPNNVEDLKLATNELNKDGSQVKVILISQAGSEGLDFKFIRQTHIIEPWYNTNRLEQIIGRAVRTCSHKMLPFNERNVEIYFHGTIITNSTREEAADLYVYRLAELKALQIGNVSRVLKETAIDCLLNIDQTTFAVELMNTVVKQNLSSGIVLDYQVGDKPYSSTCDYMDKCAYTCKPETMISEDDITYDTYGEQFIMMNNDKIIYRIKQLFKERFYYRKARLIAEINAIRQYPVLQINAALNQMVEDKNEYITDYYDRLGRLVNIGDMYLFQPMELDNKNISLYDRTVPVDYKRESIIFEIRNVNEQPNVESKNIDLKTKKKQKKRADKQLVIDAEELITTMKNNYDIANTLQTLDDKNWYKYCSIVINRLISEGEDRELLDRILMQHIIESLQFNETLTVLNYLESNKSDDLFLKKIKDYYKNIELTNNGITGIQLQHVGKQQLIVSSNTVPKVWSVAQQEDYRDLQDKIREMIESIMPLDAKMGNVIGFMSSFKKQFMTFKFRDMSIKGKKGARCDQASKSVIVNTLNKLFGEGSYKTTTKKTREELCIIQEFAIRKFNIERKDGKRWILSPGEAVLI